MSKLRQVVEQELQKAKSLCENFEWENPAAYGNFLVQTYHMISSTPRILALAAACAPMDKQSFHNRLVDHAKEERGHDKLAVMDLNALGMKLEDFPALHPTSAIYQIQYYWIQHCNPVAIYGYILALETMAERCGSQVGQRIIKAHGANAARFLRVHAEEDIEHTKSAFEIVENLTEAEQDLVCENLKLSAELYRQMLVQVMSHTNALKMGSSNTSDYKVTEATA